MDDPIRLRHVEPADLEAFFAYQSDPVAWHMVAFAAKEPRDRTSFDAHWRKVLADPAIVVRTITRGERVVGNVLCFPQGTEREVGYWVAREDWGRGIATAALREPGSAPASGLPRAPRAPRAEHLRGSGSRCRGCPCPW